MVVIQEVIVVEGKDDINALKRAVNCQIIATSGMGITDDILNQIEQAYHRSGIIVFTDPDFPGDKIRTIIRQRLPQAKHAYLTQDQAKCKKTGKIGVEYAQVEDIREALKKAKAVTRQIENPYTIQDLVEWGLVGTAHGGQIRQKLAQILGIGKVNGKQFLNRINSFNIPRSEIEQGLLSIEGLGNNELKGNPQEA